MGSYSGQILDLGSALIKRAAPDQAGLFSGADPLVVSKTDPLRLWVIQVIVIIGTTQLLALLLSRIRQPRVIAEVIGGVILGPSIMGRIPNFTNTIFPVDSIPVLTLTANVGLVFFLFLVGLEVDMGLVRRNARASSTISVAGLVVPLGLGAALGVPLYHQFIDPSVNFGYFLLFTAVAVGITAFPVLCRILTELKLLDTTVGIIVLSAGVGNDVVGWILLALTVALVNAGSGLTALWVLLTSVGYVLFLLFPIKWGYVWLVRRTGSLESGRPTTLMMTVTLLLVLASSFFTDVIGVHAIFGGFLAGLVIPKDNGYAISLVEKLEDLVSILFLPLYFALSGLNTNLGLLDNGITWGYVVVICLFAFVSKFFACGIAAKLSGFNIREAGAIGALMSCKGLVELIVLNVGLQAGILNTRVFSMFVLHAIILTFMTTPLTILLYPARVRIKSGVPQDGHAREDGTERKTHADNDDNLKTRFSVILDKIEQLPAIMTITQLLQRPVSSPTASLHRSSTDEKAPVDDMPVLARTPTSPQQTPITVDALRLIELDDRTSTVLRSQGVDVLIHTDPAVSVFRTFGLLNRFPVSASLAVVASEQFAATVSTHVKNADSEMVIVPWAGSFVRPTDDTAGPNMSPHAHGQASSVVYSQFVRKLFAESAADVALFLDGGLSTDLAARVQGHHIVLPFFGGPDDRLALSFVVQLCMNEGVSATVVRITKADADALGPVDTIEEIKFHNTIGLPDTVYGGQDTQTRLQSITADNLIWERYASSRGPFAAGVPEALGRMTFREETTASPLHAILELVSPATQGATPIVVLGRSRRLAVESHRNELLKLVAERGLSVASDVSKTMGDVAAALVGTGARASLLVVQAASTT